MPPSSPRPHGSPPTRRSDDLLAELTESQEAMRQATNVSRFRAADSAFHLAIATAAQNDLLYQAVEDARAMRSHLTVSLEELRSVLAASRLRLGCSRVR